MFCDAAAITRPSAAITVDFSDPAPRSMPSSRSSDIAGPIAIRVNRAVARGKAQLARVEDVLRINRRLYLAQQVHANAMFSVHPAATEEATAVVMRNGSTMRQRLALGDLPQTCMKRQRLVLIHRRQAQRHVLAHALGIDMAPMGREMRIGMDALNLFGNRIIKRVDM